MYPVSGNFLNKMKADRRRVLARAVIDYTDPFIDQSLEVEANEQANVSYPQQTADSVDQTTHKYACLDGTWDLTSGEYHLAPSANMLHRYQMGWWGAQFADQDGYFSQPHPTLTVRHLPRPIRSLRVVGDTAREEYPVDFTIKLYAQDDTLLKTETVTGNDQVSWSKTLEPQVLDVAKQVLEITKWSLPGTCAKIIEFFTSIREVYETGDLVNLRLLEEREAAQGSLPVGNISSNEISLALSNEDGKFDIDNEQSPLKNLLKPNRKIQVWLGTGDNPELIFDGEDDYIEIPNSSTFNLQQAITVEAEINLSSVERVVVFVAKRNTSPGLEYSWELTLGTTLTLRGCINSNDNIARGLTVLKPNTTYHVAMTYNKSKIIVYLNGEIEAEFNYTENISLTSTPICIGRRFHEGAEEWINGTISNVRIWNIARTQNEIKENMFKDLNGNEPGLIGYWKLHEGEGTTATDSTANGNHGLIYSAKWFDGWIPLGTFWSLDWDSPDDTLEATVTARDRMELLRKSTFQTSQALQNKSLYELAEIVLQDAGLTSDQYIIDTALQNIIVPYAWFNPVSHREALRQIAEVGLAAAFQNRDGEIQIESFLLSGDEPVLEITEDDYFPPLRAPSRQDQVANEIIVDTQPLRPATTPEEVYRSNEPVMVPANSTQTLTVYYNKTPVIDAVATLDSPPEGVAITEATYYGWGASIKIANSTGTDQQATLVIQGKPLTVQNKERAIARDETSIIENGILRFEFPENPLVQTLAQAQAIANTLLASVKEPRRDIEVDWRGNPALLLGDRVTVKGKDYHVIRQEIDWQGYLQARLTGRKSE